MIYSADHLGPAEARRAVAIEPMTCPPNALRSGSDLIVIAAGESFRCSFSLAEL
jgi:aldose 1-epimerase